MCAALAGRRGPRSPGRGGGRRRMSALGRRKGGRKRVFWGGERTGEGAKARKKRVSTTPHSVPPARRWQGRGGRRRRTGRWQLPAAATTAPAAAAAAAATAPVPPRSPLPPLPPSLPPRLTWRRPPFSHKRPRVLLSHRPPSWRHPSPGAVQRPPGCSERGQRCRCILEAASAGHAKPC